MTEHEDSGSSNRDEHLAEVARFLGRLLGSSHLEAALIGGHAVNFWERPRFTDDFDFTVTADAAAVRRVVDGLLGAGFRITRNQAEKAPPGPDFVQLKNARTGDTVQLQTAKTDYQEGLIRRAVRKEPSQPWQSPPVRT
jgi:hypothetical protein